MRILAPLALFVFIALLVVAGRARDDVFTNRLVGGLAAGAVGLPGVLAAVLGIGLELAWAGTATAVAAIVAGVIAAVAIILSSQYVVAVGAQLAVSASARRLVTAVARAVIVVALAAATTEGEA